MRPASTLRYYYLTWFSQPVADRLLYKELHASPVRSIVELGVGRGDQTLKLFESALKPVHESEPLRYTGIDLFEARPASSPGFKLKDAFKQLQCDGVKVQLVPGDPLMALSRMANSLTGTDVLIIRLEQQGESLAQAWRFVPRMLHAQSRVFIERNDKKPGTTKFELLRPIDVERLANEASKAMRRAA